MRRLATIQRVLNVRPMVEVNERLLQVGRDLVNYGIGAGNGDRAREVMRALVGEVERIQREINEKEKQNEK